MKRSDFLAFIPALSAIPLIGKEIVQKADKIEIYQPNEVKNWVRPEEGKTELIIVKDGQIIGNAFVRSFIVEGNITGPVHLKFDGEVISPTNEIVRTMYDVFKMQ